MGETERKRAADVMCADRARGEQGETAEIMNDSLTV